MKKLLSVCLALALALVPLLGATADSYVSTASVQNSAAQSGETTASVVGGWLRLRQAPSTSSITLASYPTGTQVTVLGASGQWMYVRTPDGRYGYMSASYLRVNGSAGSTMYVTSENRLPVRLRTGPSLSYGVFGKYSVGTPVTLLQQGSTWHRIRIGSTEGYMMSRYLTYTTPSYPSTQPTARPTSQPSYGYTAFVTSKNGGNVLLREGAGTNYGVLASYPVGTSLTVLQSGVTWSLVSVNGNVGYMMTQFISTDKPSGNVNYVMKSVSLSNYSPKVGTVLSASFAPSSATVTYTWMDDAGGVLSYNKTFTVTEKQLGMRICLAVNGYGSYSGKVVSNYTNAVTAASTSTGGQRVIISGVAIDNAAPKVGNVIRATVLPAGAEASIQWFRENGTQVGSGTSYTVQGGDAGYRLYCYATAKNNTSGAAASAYTAAVVAQQQALAGTVTLPNAASVGTTVTPSLNLNSANVTYAWYQNGVMIATGASLTLTESMLGDDIRLVVTAATGSGYTGQVGSNYCIVQRAPGTSPGIIGI